MIAPGRSAEICCHRRRSHGGQAGENRLITVRLEPQKKDTSNTKVLITAAICPPSRAFFIGVPEGRSRHARPDLISTSGKCGAAACDWN